MPVTAIRHGGATDDQVFLMKGSIYLGIRPSAHTVVIQFDSYSKPNLTFVQVAQCDSHSARSTGTKVSLQFVTH